jgi:hypothetical protein
VLSRQELQVRLVSTNVVLPHGSECPLDDGAAGPPEQSGQLVQALEIVLRQVKADPSAPCRALPLIKGPHPVRRRFSSR